MKMPSTGNAAGRRKVRCPKCTALLTEPQTQKKIYECPICLTLLLAKGNPSSKLQNNRVVKGSGEVDVQQHLEGGGKLEKMTLINEYGKDFEGRSKTTQEGFNPSDFDNESLSGISTTRVTTEPVDYVAVKNSALAPNTPPDTPFRRKFPHDAETSPRGGSEHQSSELDSVSHSGSEVDVDSPIWSSENANVNEVTEVSSRQGGEFSAERMSPSRHGLSGGAAGNDDARNPQEGTRSDSREPSDARNFDVQKANDEDCCEVADDKGGDSPSDNLAGSAGSRIAPNNEMDSSKERLNGNSKKQSDSEIPKVGKFGLFDLSVFGIYNEDTYSELRRGKAAHYTKLSESGSDGEVPRSTADGDLASCSLEVTPQTSSREQNGAGNNLDKSTDEVKESYEVRGLAGGSLHTDMGSHGQVHEDEEPDTEVVISHPVGQEVDYGAMAGSVGLLPDSSVDSDVLANARYGDYMTVRDVSLDGVSSVDISFGDWRLQQAVSPPQKPLEQTYMDTSPLYEQGRLDLAAGEEGSESSWDDDEEDLTFSSTSKEDSKGKGMSLDNNAKPPLSRRRSVGRSVAKALSENLAFPIRTTAMQNFLLQRNEPDTQEAITPELEQSEAPSVEHRTTLLRQEVHESSTPELVSQDATTIIIEDKRQMIATSEEVEDDTKITERRDENTYSIHTMVVSNVGNEAVSPAPVVSKEDHAQTNDAGQLRKERPSLLNEAVPLPPLGWKEKDMLKGSVEDYYAQPSEESDAMRGPQKAEAGMEMRADLDSQNVDGFKQHPATRTGVAPVKPVSLRWKGRSSNQSLSSTDDDGAYGMESEAGSGPDKDFLKEQGVGLTHGSTFPDRDAQQWTRSHTRTYLNNIDMDRQKHGSGELITSRRSARSRAANARLLSQETFEHVEAIPFEGRIPIQDSLGRPRPEHTLPTHQGQELNINMSRVDQGSNYLYDKLAGYSSDHSSRSQDVPSRSNQYNEAFVSNPYGMAAGGSTQAYPYQVSAPARASSQDSGLTGATHHCLSPTCSLCMQQQYYMQPAQMLQNVMLPHCAACASQSSAATYHQPVHHGMHHSHHLHGSTHLNPPLRQHDSGALPPQSRRQGMSSIHHSHPLPLARRPKLYPPLPGKDAPPYVLCKHCNQLLEVPGYLLPVSQLVQKLQCGSCDKISKFSVPLQADSPSTDRAQWAASGGVAVHASGMRHFLARDKRQQIDTSSIYSSNRAAASGLSASAKNLYGMVAHTSGQGSHQEWVDDRVFLQSSTSGAAQAETAVLRHQARPMAGGVPAKYRRYERNDEGDHPHNSTGLYSEGYISSSPSSPSGSSPGRPSQIHRQHHQQGEPARQRRPGYGERKLTPDQDADRPSYEVPRFSDDFYQKGPVESRNRLTPTSLQGSLHGQYSDGPDYDHLDRLQQASRAGSWHDQLAETEYSGRTALRNRMEQIRRMPVAPGSPLMEHFSQDSEDAGLVLQQRHMPQNTDSGARSAWSPVSESPHVDSLVQDSLTEFSERSYERERPPLPVQDASKGPKSFAGMFKKSVKDFGRGGQGGSNRRKVVVNGHVIQEVAVRKAEERAGPVHSGSYWYDYQAGFWGVMGGPCLGILMPGIEEFHYPLARDWAGGRTGILVNGRELHERDLEVLAKRGLPTISGKAYVLDISGALFDDTTSQPLRGLGKLAPSIEKRGRGFGMSPVTALP